MLGLSGKTDLPNCAGHSSHSQSRIAAFIARSHANECYRPYNWLQTTIDWPDVRQLVDPQPLSPETPELPSTCGKPQGPKEKAPKRKNPQAPKKARGLALGA